MCACMCALGLACAFGLVVELTNITSNSMMTWWSLWRPCAHGGMPAGSLCMELLGPHCAGESCECTWQHGLVVVTHVCLAWLAVHTCLAGGQAHSPGTPTCSRFECLPVKPGSCRMRQADLSRLVLLRVHCKGCWPVAAFLRSRVADKASCMLCSAAICCCSLYPLLTEWGAPRQQRRLCSTFATRGHDAWICAWMRHLVDDLLAALATAQLAAQQRHDRAASALAVEIQTGSTCRTARALECKPAWFSHSHDGSTKAGIVMLTLHRWHAHVPPKPSSRAAQPSARQRPPLTVTHHS